MKKLKMLGAGIFLCLGITSLSSCNNESKPVIDMTEDIEEYTFSSITLDTSNAKTTFYVDDDFTYEGLKVTAVYTMEVDDVVNAIEEEITTYTVDTELVDMSTIGSYIVTVNGRSGMSQQSEKYTIQVISRESAVSDELYLAGLDVEVQKSSTGYKDSHTITFTQGDSFVLPIISAQKIYFKGTEISESDSQTVSVAALTVDSTNVNPNKRGSYYIVYSYTKDGVTVKSFVIVEVINQVTAIAFKSGNTSQKATVDGFDYSDWMFTLTRQTGDTEEFAYDEDYITIEDVNYLVASSYTATIKYKDEDMQASVKTTQDVEVTESDSVILIETNFSGFASLPSQEKIALGDSGKFYVYATEASSSGYGEPKEPTIDGLTFTYRGKMGTGSKSNKHLEVIMPSAGNIVLYCGTSGSARVLECCNSEGDVISQTTLTSSATKVIVNATEAGSYYFYSTGSTLYFYGAIIAYAK